MTQWKDGAQLDDLNDPVHDRRRRRHCQRLSFTERFLALYEHPKAAQINIRRIREVYDDMPTTLDGRLQSILKHRGGREIDFATNVNDGCVLEVFGLNLEQVHRASPEV